MAFPDNYEENTSRCMGRYKDHNWSTTGHPIGHRCNDCHQRRWKEVRVEQEIPKTYVAPVVWGGYGS